MVIQKTKVATEEFYGARNPTKIWDVDVANIILSKLIKTKNNSKYLIGYLNDVVRTLALI